MKKFEWPDLNELYTEKKLSSSEIAIIKNCSSEAVLAQLRRKDIHVRTTSEASFVKQGSLQCDWSDLGELYLDKCLGTREISEIKGCSPSLVSYRMKLASIPSRSVSEALKIAREAGKIHCKRGESHPNWKGGRRKRVHGYIQLKNPSHPRASKDGGYVFEHILVWERVHDKPLPEGWVVHHLNGITNDNRPQNLVAMPAQKHRKDHQTINLARKQRIRELEEENRLLKKALDDGQMIFNLSEN